MVKREKKMNEEDWSCLQSGKGLSILKISIWNYSFYLSFCRVGHCKLIIWSQRAFTTSTTCLSGLNLLLGTWGTSKGDCQEDQAFFVMVTHEFWLVWAPTYIKCLHVKYDLMGNQINPYPAVCMRSPALSLTLYYILPLCEKILICQIFHILTTGDYFQLIS